MMSWSTLGYCNPARRENERSGSGMSAILEIDQQGASVWPAHLPEFELTRTVLKKNLRSDMRQEWADNLVVAWGNSL